MTGRSQLKNKMTGGSYFYMSTNLLPSSKPHIIYLENNFNK